MNAKRLMLAGLVVLTLACNALSRRIDVPVMPTATPSPLPLEPAYIPPQCANLPLATVPAATALAKPTPVLQANPPISSDLQLRVFEQTVKIIEDAYVDPNFNGVDWPALVAEYRGKIEGGLDTEAFYTEMQAFIAALGDEHSYIESPVEVALSEAELSGATDFVGIGVLAMPLTEKGYVTILSVFPASPAEHSGIKPHDSLLSVDGLPLVEGEESFMQRVRGPECSAAVIEVQSPGQAPRRIMLVREQITSPLSVEPRLVPTTDGSRIGYIFLPTFFDQTIPDSVASALRDFGPLDGLILDNRMNGGGSSAVVEPILAFFTGGTLGSYVSRKGPRPLTIEPNPIHNSDTVPLVILVGEDTVSYGEIFSGALQDSGRAMIVGQTTLGNVETLHGHGLEDGSRLWLAEETFSPITSQTGWEETGIIPDMTAYADWDTFTFENDPAIAAALALLGHK